MEARGASVWTFRDGKISTAKLFQSKREALAAIELGELAIARAARGSWRARAGATRRPARSLAARRPAPPPGLEAEPGERRRRASRAAPAALDRRCGAPGHRPSPGTAARSSGRGPSRRPGCGDASSRASHSTARLHGRSPPASWRPARARRAAARSAVLVGPHVGQEREAVARERPGPAAPGRSRAARRSRDGRARAWRRRPEGLVEAHGGGRVSPRAAGPGSGSGRSAG